MGKVIVDLSMSLDGFITGPNDSIGLPLGAGGEHLHDWIFSGSAERSGTSPRTSATGINRAIMEEAFRTTGATIMGRRWFEAGEKPWGDDPPFHTPIFVLTHQARETITKGKTTFMFVIAGIQSALEQAQAAAGKNNVVVGGANVAQQYIRAGLIDEINIHLVPILLGDGVRLFHDLDKQQMELDRTRVVIAPEVTHLRFRVVK